MKQEAQYLLINRFKIAQENSQSVIDLWKKIFPDDTNVLYFNKHENELLYITSVENPSQVTFAQTNHTFETFKDTIKVYLESDFHAELLELKNVVKEQKSKLPHKKYLQLRHIEVPLKVHDDYLDWRKNTIFKYVAEQENIDSFIAYHSFFSTKPGVMFLSSFSCEIDDYLSTFLTPTYQEIVKTAGNKYIAGGKDGLYTIIFEKV